MAEEFIQTQADLLSVIKYLLEQLWSIKSNAIHNHRIDYESTTNEQAMTASNM